MKSNIYLFNPSFVFNDSATPTQISESIENLLISIEDIRKEIYENKIDNDHFLKNQEIYNIKIYKNILLSEFLYGCPREDCRQIRSGVKKALRSIIDKYSKSCDLLDQQILELVKRNNPYCLNGLLRLNPVELNDISLNYILNNKDQWYNYHRLFLAQYPINENNFYREIKKYFPQIYFHPSVENSLRRLEGGLDKFAEPIIHNLIQLRSWNEIT